MTKILAVLMFFVGLFQANVLLAGTESASWGSIKAQITEETTPSAAKLRVTPLKAGGWRGKDRQPRMLIPDNAIMVYRGHDNYLLFTIWNQRRQTVAGADIRIEYDPDQVLIDIYDRDKPKGFFLEANTLVPGLVRVAMASAEGIKEEAFVLFHVFIRPPANAPIGSKVSFIAEIVFYNEHGEKIGAHTARWVFTVAE